MKPPNEFEISDNDLLYLILQDIALTMCIYFILGSNFCTAESDKLGSWLYQLSLAAFFAWFFANFRNPRSFGPL